MTIELKEVNNNNKNSIKSFILGPMQMLFSAFGFAIMTLFTKLATENIPSAEVAFFRLILGVVVSLAFVFTTGLKLINPNFKMLVVRGFFGGLAVLIFFIAIEKGTLTNSVVLQNTYPIFAAFIALYTLKERLTIKHIACLIITFSGIMLLTKPNFENVRIGDVFAIIAAILGAFAVTAVRSLRKMNESVWTIFFYFCIFGAVMSLIFAIPNWIWPNANDLLLLILTGIFGLLGQVTMTAAYKYCTATLGGILSMSTSVFSFALGVIFLRESFILIDVAAVLLIIFGNVLVVIGKGEEE